MKTILFLIVGIVIALSSVICAQELVPDKQADPRAEPETEQVSSGEEMPSFPRMILESHMESFKRCSDDVKFSLKQAEDLMKREWNYKLKLYEANGICCLLKKIFFAKTPVKTYDWKQLKMSPEFFSNAIEMIKADNPAVPVDDIIQKCQLDVRIEAKNVNFCSFELRSAQFIHCFASSVNAATNGKFLESFSMDAPIDAPSNA